jgi:hypothetical protein
MASSKHIDRDELEKERARNLKERLDFILLYVSWIKRTPNKEWSA